MNETFRGAAPLQSPAPPEAVTNESIHTMIKQMINLDKHTFVIQSLTVFDYIVYPVKIYFPPFNGVCTRRCLLDP